MNDFGFKTIINNLKLIKMTIQCKNQMIHTGLGKARCEFHYNVNCTFSFFLFHFFSYFFVTTM